MPAPRLEESELLLEQDLEAPLARSLGPGEAALFSARSPGKETPNEDALLLAPLGEARCVIAVADGVGGLPGGRDAARLVVESLSASLAARAGESNALREAVLDGLEAANRAILELGTGAASTVAVAAIDGRTVRTFHIGDAGVLVVGQRGRIKLQTVSHSPVGYALESGYLDEREAIHHADRHLISNALGREDMRVEIGSSLVLAPRDTLLVASDGLFDNLRTPEIAARIRKGPLHATFAALCAESRRRMTSPREGAPSKPDDLTAVAFRLRRA